MTEDAVRVLHVLDKITPDSGVSSVVMNYYSKLDHAKITFDFMLNEAPDAETRAYIENNGSKIYVMPALKAANVFKYVKALKAFYESSGHKIIHGHMANSAVFYLGLAKKTAPARIIHSHSVKTSDVFWKKARNLFLTLAAKRAANRFVACSEEAAAFLFGKRREAEIFPNAVNPAKFAFSGAARARVRAACGLTGEKVIGHVGRFAKVKNHKFLVDAFNMAYGKNRGLRLMLVGDGPLLPSVRRKAARLGLGEAVLFVGKTSQTPDYLSAMDVFALPSLFEGFGLACVEAQTSGLPVLASKNVPEVVNVAGGAEFLRADKGLWADKFLNTPPNRNRAAFAKLTENGAFDINAQVRALCAYYERIIL